MVCFNCKVSIQGKEIHNKEYKSLKEISSELGLTYQQVADYSVGRVKKRSTNNFIYHPSIQITKIKNKDDELVIAS